MDVWVDRYMGSCSTLLLIIYAIKYVFQNKTEDLNLSVFNMIAGLKKHKSKKSKET